MVAFTCFCHSDRLPDVITGRFAVFPSQWRQMDARFLGCSPGRNDSSAQSVKGKNIFAFFAGKNAK